MRQVFFTVLAEIIAFSLPVMAQENSPGSHQPVRDQKDLEEFQRMTVAQENSPGSHQPVRDQKDLEEFQRMTASDLAAKYLRKPPYSLLAIRRIIELGDPVVAPDLQRAFEDEADATRRQFIAAALISLGKADVPHFDYLSAAATAAIASVLPFPGFLSVATGLGAQGAYRPDFISAVQEEKLEFAIALRQAGVELPAAVEALGEAADMRAFPILVKGLDSRNIAIVRAAAFGLARLHDNAGVPPIVASSGHLSPEERPIVAKALLYFDSPAARQAAAAMIPDQILLERWRKEANRRGWKNAMRDNLH